MLHGDFIEMTDVTPGAGKTLPPASLILNLN